MWHLHASSAAFANLAEAKRKSTAYLQLKSLCLFKLVSVQYTFVRKHNGWILVPYLSNSAPLFSFFFIFLPIFGISAYSLQATLSITSHGVEKV